MRNWQLQLASRHFPLTYWKNFLSLFEKEGKRSISSEIKQFPLRITCKAHAVCGSLIAFSNVFHFYVLSRYKGFSSCPCVPQEPMHREEIGTFQDFFRQNNGNRKLVMSILSSLPNKALVLLWQLMLNNKSSYRR